MATYILFGTNAPLGEAREAVEKLLSLKFEGRVSDYQSGEYFLAGDKAGEYFELKRNLDPFDGDPAEMNFPEFPTLLYINATSRSKTLKEIVGGAQGEFSLLRHEDF